MITLYPPAGSRWMVKTGPDIKPFEVEVTASGHGWVVFQGLKGKYPKTAVDVLVWNRYYQAQRVDNA